MNLTRRQHIVGTGMDCIALWVFSHLSAQMGLHVFFGCYFNLFRLMAKCGVLENLLLKVG